jgi:hypothetical protein
LFHYKPNQNLGLTPKQPKTNCQKKRLNTQKNIKTQILEQNGLNTKKKKNITQRTLETKPRTWVPKQTRFGHNKGTYML